MTHPLTSILLLAACTLTALAIYGWPRRAAPGARLLLPLLVCAVVWSCAAALELWAPSQSGGAFWHRVSWLGMAPLPILWLLFCVDFTGSWSAIKTRGPAALLAAPVLLAVILLVTSVVGSTQSSSRYVFEALELVAALAQLYGWLLTAIGMAFLVRRFHRSSSIYRSQCAVLVVAGAVPFAIHVWHLLAPFVDIDPTPASFNVAALVLGWGLFSYRLFDMTPIAYETVFNAMGDGVFVTDARSRITSVNPVALAGLGKSLDEVLGRPLDEVFAGWPDAREAGGAACERVELNVVSGGRERDVELRAFPVYDGERRLYGRVYISQDVTDRNAYQRRIEEMAYRDFLTSLPNRRALYEEAQRALAFGRRRDLQVSLLFIDLDGFKDVNDALGHPAGDLLLQYVATRLLATIRKEDILARLGGDEFAVLLIDCDADGARAAADRVLLALREPPFEVRRTRLHLQASIGIACFAGGAMSVDELLAQADTAMYQAKDGPGRIHVFQGHEGPHVAGQARPEDEFREALRLRQLIFKYQPILDLATGNVMAAEALVRWEHPTRGLTHPSSFLSMVEERDLALELDRYALQHALAEVASSHLDVCINLSARSVLDRQLVDVVASALHASGLSPRRLILEITERVLAVPELTRPVLFELRKLGVRIAADDFGTGYSALAYLRHFPLSMLKLDRFLVAGIGRRVEDEAIIRAVIMIARTMGLVVIGEGVETREQMRWLKAEGCHAVQGFHIARPERWNAFQTWEATRAVAGPRKLKLVG